MLTVGIVEQVFESQGVCRCGVEIIVGLIDEYRVLCHRISHQTEVTLPCHTTVGRVIAAASSNTSGMGAVVLLASVRSTLLRQDVCRRRPFTAYRQSLTVVIGSQLVPKRLDAVFAQCRIVIECGMCQVEADVHQSHHDAPSRKGGMVGSLLVEGQQTRDDGHGVHRRMALVVGFYTQHVRLLRQAVNLVQRHGDDGNIA